MSKISAPTSPTLPRKGGGRKEARAWQRMQWGRRLDLLDPSPLDVELDDIAHGLARVARWNGQTRGAHIFSVAQHSVFVQSNAGRLDPRMTARRRLHTMASLIFSVAHLSVFVESIAVSLDPGLPASARLTILLHDAAEYVIGDI